MTSTHSQPKSPNRRSMAAHVHDRANPPAPPYGVYEVPPDVGMEALPTKPSSKQLVGPERELAQERAPPVVAATEPGASPQIEEMEVDTFNRPLFTLEYQAALEADTFSGRHLAPNDEEHSPDIASIQSQPHQVSPPIQQQEFFSKDISKERLTLHRPQFQMPMPLVWEPRLIAQDFQFFNPASNAELGVRRNQPNYSHASDSQYNPPSFNIAQKPYQIDSEFPIAQKELKMSTRQPLPPSWVERRDAAGTVCDENETRMKFVFAKIRDIGQQRVQLVVHGLAGKDPSHVGPESAVARGMRIAFLVRILVMLAMRGDPENGSAFEGERCTGR